MSASSLAALIPRKTQIFAGEIFAVLAAIHEHAEDVRDRDVLIFIDNEGGCSSLIRGNSRQADAASIVYSVHWKLLDLRCRAWFEWIDSEANPSDGLSRLGLQDSWTRAQGWDLRCGTHPPWHAVEDYRFAVNNVLHSKTGAIGA